MKKELKLQIDEERFGDVIFHIDVQTHRGHEFRPTVKCTNPIWDQMNTRHFNATNGVCLRSVGGPEVRGYSTDHGKEQFILFLRGTDKTKDDKKLRCTIDQFNMIQKAVEEYNRECTIDLLPQELFDF